MRLDKRRRFDYVMEVGAGTFPSHARMNVNDDLDGYSYWYDYEM